MFFRKFPRFSGYSRPSSSTIRSALWENAHPSLAAVGLLLATAGGALFFLAFGRCRTEARSLHEHKQSERHLYKDPGGPSKLANQNKPEKHKTNNHDDPQIPQPDLRFVKRKQQTRQKNGARPKQKTTTTKICQRTQRIYHCATPQKPAK